MLPDLACQSSALASADSSLRGILCRWSFRRWFLSLLLCSYWCRRCRFHPGVTSATLSARRMAWKSFHYSIFRAIQSVESLLQSPLIMRKSYNHTNHGLFENSCSDANDKNKTALCRYPGAVSFVGCNLGWEDHHSGGWQSDHHGAWGPAGDWPVHDCAAESREQQGHPGYHYYARGPAEPQTGQCAAAHLGAAATISSVKLLNPPSSRKLQNRTATQHLTVL